MEEEKNELEKELVENETVEPVKEEPVDNPTPPVEKEPVQTDSKGKNGWLKYALIGVGAVIIILIVLLIRSCGNGKKYAIVLHYGDEQVEVDQNFKISDLDISGGKITFLVDSDGNILEPKGKLDHEKEYSAHIVPDGKETVKVTYKNGNSQFTIEYQKGAGLLFPKDPKKAGYIFLGWQDEATKQFPKIMTPVMNDMTLVAKFGKKVGNNNNNNSCKVNCDTNNDGKCDVNCDQDGDGKADYNVDTNGDGKPDINLKPNGNQLCTANCDTNGDGKADTNIDTNGDGNPDLNIDTDGDGKCDINCDVDGDGKCDKNCEDGSIIEMNFNNPIHFTCTSDPKNAVAFYQIATCKLIYFEFDGKEIPESEFKENDGYKEYDYSSYIGSGKTVGVKLQTIYTDSTGQKYYRNRDQKITFEGNCDSKKTEPEPTPTPEEPKQDNQNQTSDNNNNNNATQDTNKNAVAPTPATPKEDTTDYGTISLSANKSCIVGSNSATVTAIVKNAKDSTITWTNDSCLTLSGSGTSRTVTANNCTSSAKVTATLANGQNSSVTFNYEPTLVVSLYYNEYSGRHTALYNDYANGYEANEIETNIKATFNVSPSSNYITSQDKYLRISNAEAGTVTVTTACGQTKTYKTLAVIN